MGFRIERTEGQPTLLQGPKPQEILKEATGKDAFSLAPVSGPNELDIADIKEPLNRSIAAKTTGPSCNSRRGYKIKLTNKKQTQEVTIQNCRYGQMAPISIKIDWDPKDPKKLSVIEVTGTRPFEVKVNGETKSSQRGSFKDVVIHSVFLPISAPIAEELANGKRVDLSIIPSRDLQTFSITATGMEEF